MEARRRPKSKPTSWKFGDTHSSNEESPTHEYTAPGSYKATLTVSAAAKIASVHLGAGFPLPVHNVKIKTRDSGEHPIAGVDVLYVGPEGTRIQATTGPEGEATLEGLPNGTDTVYAYESGFEPLVGHVKVSAGAGTATLTLLTGEVATSTLKSHELTLPEIEALGINVNDPANQHVYEFEVRLAFIEGEPPKPLHGYINSNSEFVFAGGVVAVAAADGHAHQWVPGRAAVVAVPLPSSTATP